MLQSIQLPYICPVGAGREVVDDDDPLLVRCPLVIEGSPDFIETCYGKFWDYRLWHKLVDNGLSPEVMAPDDGGRIAAAVQEFTGTTMSTLTFPKALTP